MHTIKIRISDIEAIKAHCNAKNCSVNGFIIGAALEKMKADQAQGIGTEGVDQDAGSGADQREE